MTDPLVGQLLDGRYEISRKLARGGMATVYVANDQRLTRTVAVKVMHEGLGDDHDFVSKFDREARAAARLSHPNVVSVFDQGLDRGRPYIVMEYVEGCTLRHLITRDAPLAPLQAMDLLIPVAQAVAAAHEAGLIHRDLKPENVLISDRGQIKVADFGLARAISAQTVTATGLLIGTVSYIAPELVTHGRADERSDVYALGIVLFEMLTGRKPHTGETQIQVAYSHVHNHVPAPSGELKTSWRDSRQGIPPYLDALVTAAAARRPADRPVDGGVLLDHLRTAREALAEGVMNDPAITAEMQTTSLDEDSFVTQYVPTLPNRDEDTPRIRFTPSTPVSPGHVQVDDGVPYSDSREEPEKQPYRPIQLRAQQRRRRGTLTLLAVFLLTLGLAFGTWYMVQGRYTTTPELAMLSQPEAETKAEAAGVRVTFQGEYSETVGTGAVIRTDPAGGDRLERGATVTAYLSKGPERYPVPKLVGLSRQLALDALANAHLAAGRIAEKYHDTVPAGEVISASVKPGVEAKPGTTVDLTVSRGVAPVKVVNYTGKSFADAKRALERGGLKVVVTSQENHKTVDKAHVISQEPNTGHLEKGDTVSFVVSKGPVMVTVPYVKYMNVKAATKTMESKGFTVKVVRLIRNGLGLVAYTRPGERGKAPQGSRITLYVA